MVYSYRLRFGMYSIIELGLLSHVDSVPATCILRYIRQLSLQCPHGGAILAYTMNICMVATLQCSHVPGSSSVALITSAHLHIFTSSSFVPFSPAVVRPSRWEKHRAAQLVYVSQSSSVAAGLACPRLRLAYPCLRVSVYVRTM